MSSSDAHRMSHNQGLGRSTTCPAHRYVIAAVLRIVMPRITGPPADPRQPKITSQDFDEHST